MPTLCPGTPPLSEHSDINAGLALVTAVQRPKAEIRSDWCSSLEYVSKKQMDDPVISVLGKWIELDAPPQDSLKMESPDLLTWHFQRENS